MLECPDEAADIVLGGSCDPLPEAVVAGTEIVNGPAAAKFQCTWKQTPGNLDSLRVRVVCLRGGK